MKRYCNPFLNKPCFYVSAAQYKAFENIVGRGEIALRCNFSFSCSVFYPFGELFAIFINLELFSGNSFSLEESKICHLGKG